MSTILALLAIKIGAVWASTVSVYADVYFAAMRYCGNIISPYENS